jgi:threonine aldolase
MDGARVWNASVACDDPVDVLCAPFDSVTVCFSKGLGAPVGSAFCGSKALVHEARRLRRRWGGAMRQAGILAAGALHALDHHRARLADDHAHAHLLAVRLAACLEGTGASVDVAKVETNLVFVELAGPATSVVERARSLGVLLAASGPATLRLVTHLDVSRADAERAADLIASAIEATRAARERPER